MEKFSIHRGLSELKVMGDRINKSITELMPCSTVQKGKLVANLYTPEKFSEMASANFQSILALIDRRNKIKSAIVTSNGVTKVTIAKNEMTVAEAINLKTVIEFKKRLIERLKGQYRAAVTGMETGNTKAEANALEIAKVALGKANVKLTDNDVVKVTESYLEMNLFTLVDPLKAEDKIKELEEALVAFETEVDACLSETNAITQIEI